MYNDWQPNVLRSAESESDIVKQGNSNKYEQIVVFPEVSGFWKLWGLMFLILLVVVFQMFADTKAFALLTLTRMALCLFHHKGSDKTYTNHHTSSRSPPGGPDSCIPAREDEPSSTRPKSPQPPTHGKDSSHCKIAAKAPKEPHFEPATEISKDKEQRPEPASNPDQSQRDEPSTRPKSAQPPTGGKYSSHVDFSEAVPPPEVNGRSNDNFCTDSSAVENHTGDPTVPPTDSDSCSYDDSIDIDTSTEDIFEQSKRSKEHARLEANNCTNEPMDGGDGHGNSQGGGSSGGGSGGEATGSGAGSGGGGGSQSGGGGGSMGGGAGGGDDRKPPFDGGPKHETDEVPISESKIKRKQQKATTTSGIGSSLSSSSSHEKDQLPEDLRSPTSIVSQEENPPTGTNDSTAQLVSPSSPLFLNPTTSSYKKLFPRSSQGGFSPVEQQNETMQGMHNHVTFERPVSQLNSEDSGDWKHPRQEINGGASVLLLPRDTKASIQELQGEIVIPSPRIPVDDAVTEEMSSLTDGITTFPQVKPEIPDGIIPTFPYVSPLQQSEVHQHHSQELQGPPDDHMDDSVTEEKSIFSVHKDIKPFLNVYPDMHESDIVPAFYPEQESEVHGASTAEGEDHPPSQCVPYSIVYPTSTTYQLPPHSLVIVPDLRQLAIPPHQEFPCEPVQQMEVESMRPDDGTATGGRNKSMRPDDGTATGERDKSMRSDDGTATGERDKSMRSGDGTATGERDKSMRSGDGTATGERDKSMRSGDGTATGERDKSMRSGDGTATGERDKSMRSGDGTATGERDKSMRSGDGTATGERDKSMRSGDGTATGERDKSMRSGDGTATGERDKSMRSGDGTATGERDKSMRSDDGMATGERDKSMRSDDGMATGERDKSMRSGDGTATGERDKSMRSGDGMATGERDKSMRGHEYDSDIDRYE